MGEARKVLFADQMLARTNGVLRCDVAGAWRGLGMVG
jgi:hypothetical protein